MNTDKIFLLDYTLFEIQFDQHYKKITLVLIPWPTSIPPWEMAIVPSAWYIDIIAVNWEPKYAIPYLRGTTLIPRFRQRLFWKTFTSLSIHISQHYHSISELKRLRSKKAPVQVRHQKKMKDHLGKKVVLEILVNYMTMYLLDQGLEDDNYNNSFNVVFITQRNKLLTIQSDT